MILFFTSDLTVKNPTLEEDEFQHCCKVLRHKVGDHISITNGKGIFANARINKINKRSAELEVISTDKFAENERKIVLAIAPPKNRSRWEWLIEKSIEIGVDVIIPMTTHHSERAKLNLERSRKIMRSAALQSKRKWHPTLTEITSFDSILKDKSFDGSDKFIAHYKVENPHLRELQKGTKSAVIFVGPEGDFSPEEIESARTQNYTLVNISSNRLRTETAAIVCATFLV